MIGVPFTLSISPSPQSVAPAGTASFNITATNNVSGQPAQQINLNWMDPNANLAQFGCSGYPSLPQFTFNLPSTVTTGQASVTATITPPINTASFNCIFEISGSFGLFNTLASGQMDITTAPSYTFSQPATQTVTGSGQANFPLSVSSVNSFAGTVNFTASVSSQGVACGINVSSISSAYVSAGGVGQTTMTVNVPAGCAVGNYTVAISSSSSGSASSPTETATLAVQTAPDFTLTISGPQTMLQGSSTQPYTISVAPASGSSFSGSVSLSLGNGGAITGGVTLGSLSASASQNSAGTLMLNVANNATLGTYPILVTASSSGITHSVLARLTVNLGSNPGTTIQLGSIAVPIGSATTPSTIPPTIIVPPLVSGDSLNSSGCTTTVAGTSAVVGLLPGSTTGVQTLTLSAPSTVQAGAKDTLTCTTAQGRVTAAAIEYVDQEDVELDYNAQGGGLFLLTATTSGFSEVDDIVFTGSTSSGPLPPDDVSGDQSANDTVYLPAGSCAVVWVTVSGFDLDGDGDNGGPAWAEASTQFCYDYSPPPPPPPTITLNSVSWNLASSQGTAYAIMKDGTAAGSWTSNTYQSNGSIAIVNPTWQIAVGNSPAVQDPVVYQAKNNFPQITFSQATSQLTPALTMAPAPSTITPVKLRVVASPPELTFPDQYAYFNTNGALITQDQNVTIDGANVGLGGWASTTTVSFVHNQNYTLTWYVSFDEGATFQQFGTSTQQMFFVYGGPGYITPPGGSPQGAWTAKRLDFATVSAEGKGAVLGSLASNPSITQGSPSAFVYTTYGITEAAVATVAHTVRFGNGLLGANLSTQGQFWSLLDTAPGLTSDCLGLAGLTAYVTAQLGIASVPESAYPPLAAGPLLPAVTDATVPSQEPLPAQYQDARDGTPFYYTLFYNNAFLTYGNQIEGYFQVYPSGTNGPPTAFTVGPAAGPYTPTTCYLSPNNTPTNQVAFNVISQTLIAVDQSRFNDPTFVPPSPVVPVGSNDLYWVDYNNPHPYPDPNAPNDPATASATTPPQLALYTMQRLSMSGSVCKASDMLPAPTIQWPII